MHENKIIIFIHLEDANNPFCFFFFVATKHLKKGIPIPIAFKAFTLIWLILCVDFRAINSIEASKLNLQWSFPFPIYLENSSKFEAEEYRAWQLLLQIECKDGHSYRSKIVYKKIVKITRNI